MTGVMSYISMTWQRNLLKTATRIHNIVDIYTTKLDTKLITADVT